jgi:hypothetical protein
MGDGSYVAFFDLGDDVKPEPSPNTPAWVNHLALELDSEEELAAAKGRLQAAGIEVLGITDHHIIHSIYFFDPNGIRAPPWRPPGRRRASGRPLRPRNPGAAPTAAVLGGQGRADQLGEERVAFTLVPPGGLHEAGDGGATCGHSGRDYQRARLPRAANHGRLALP